MDIEEQLTKRLKSMGYSKESIKSFEDKLKRLKAQEILLICRLLITRGTQINGFIIGKLATELGLDWNAVKKDVLSVMSVWSWRLGQDIGKQSGTGYLCLNESKVKRLNKRTKST
jgi:hypothetical protein